MLDVDLSRPPAVPSELWLAEFARRLRAIEPSFGQAEAVEQANNAYSHTWLLEPAEAALIWKRALRSRQRAG